VDELPSAARAFALLQHAEQQAHHRSRKICASDHFEVDELARLVKQADDAAVGNHEDGTRHEHEADDPQQVRTCHSVPHAERRSKDHEDRCRPLRAGEPLAQQHEIRRRGRVREEATRERRDLVTGERFELVVGKRHRTAGQADVARRGSPEGEGARKCARARRQDPSWTSHQPRPVFGTDAYRGTRPRTAHARALNDRSSWSAPTRRRHSSRSASRASASSNVQYEPAGPMPAGNGVQ